MKKTVILAALLMMFIPLKSATATEASPYIMGEWFLGDSLEGIATQDTVFSFLNPTPLGLVLEYAFFEEDGTFCGCDIDDLDPNGVVRYTMSGEKAEGLFKCSGSHGTMKSIVLVKRPRFLTVDGALQLGFQIHLFTGGRSEAGMKSIPVTDLIFNEMVQIHNSCKSFKPSGKTLLELRKK